jgi:hypothetical protein
VDISAASFRDRKIGSFAVTYDWETECHVADISVRSNDGILHRYRIVGLSELNVSEDFGHVAYIEFCSFIMSPGRIYLSFDPYTEGVESDRDNFSFVGRDIIKLD